MVTRIKICGITNVQDLELALELGVDAVGFIMEPTSPRYARDLCELQVMLRLAKPFCTTVAVFGIQNFDPDPLFKAIQRVGPSEARFEVDRELIQAIRMGGDAQPESIRTDATAILLDAYSPNAFGGTGKTVDWDKAAEFKQTVAPVPLILAGGLTPENVVQAIELVRPYAVDVSSGVEASPGKKDAAKLRDFVAAVRSTNPV